MELAVRASPTAPVNGLALLARNPTIAHEAIAIRRTRRRGSVFLSMEWNNKGQQLAMQRLVAIK